MHITARAYTPVLYHVWTTARALSNVSCVDHCTGRQLELVRSLGGGWRNSLFGAMRNTKTQAGARLLRATLLQVTPIPRRERGYSGLHSYS